MTRTRKPKPSASPSQIELRRWCVEMAVRWPTITENYYGGGMMGGGAGGVSSRTTDADVIGRAKKIEAYVTAA